MPTLYQAPHKHKKHDHRGKSVVDASSTTMNPLTAFALRPTNVRFETQEAGETVILFLRQHFIVNIPWIFIAFFLIVTPSFLFPLVLRSIPFSLAVPAGYMLIGTLFWYLASIGFILANFIHWFFNIYIVTNERIVDIDFIHLLYKEFSQTELDKIQDISFATGGILATIFDFGSVTIETAGEAPNLEFTAVPKPGRVVETIREATEILVRT